MDCPHGIIVDRRDGTPVLTVADRGNARIQRFTLDGKHIDFVSGTNMPCHFNFFKNGDVVVPDLGARVTLLDKQNKVIAHLGDDSETKWRDTRKLSRDQLHPRQIRRSARRLLRPQRQHLRRGVGRSRPRHQIAQSLGRLPPLFCCVFSPLQSSAPYWLNSTTRQSVCRRPPPFHPPPEADNIIDYDSPHRTRPSRSHARSRRRPPPRQQERRWALGANLWNSFPRVPFTDILDVMKESLASSASA